MPQPDTEIPAEVLTRLAVDNYSGKGYESITDCLFALLADIADVYVARLEDGPGADDPAPFLGGTTPVEAALTSLAENLEMRRENAV